ncbi:hypothetical protein GCM10025861_19940 [Methanobacterium petrolearium]|nr:hypothetical protein GCM10025861_19940 [Methanobacterium petrolearium]
MSASCAACPYYGLSCTYPGQCPRFIDSGGDGICDLAQSSTTTSSSDTPSSYDSTSTDSASVSDSGSSVSTQDQTVQSNSVSADTLNNGSEANASAAADHGTGVDTTTTPDGTDYHLFPVSLILIGLYLFTHLLFSKGILSQKKHRRLWNLLLTAGYAGTGITGILLILIINLGIKTALNPSVTFWHVELSILMVMATLFHIHLYWKPFKNMFTVLFGFKSRGGKNLKKPASLLAAVALIGMVVVSGQYFSSSLDGNEAVVQVNGTNNSATNVTNDSAITDYESQSVEETTDTEQVTGTYTSDQEESQSVQDTSTSGSKNRNGKNRN